MSLKDKFDKFIDYFTEDGEETTPRYESQQDEVVVSPISTSKELPVQSQASTSKRTRHSAAHRIRHDLITLLPRAKNFRRALIQSTKHIQNITALLVKSFATKSFLFIARFINFPIPRRIKISHIRYAQTANFLAQNVRLRAPIARRAVKTVNEHDRQIRC